jgi:acetyl-CoA C-acetyltransferase
MLTAALDGLIARFGLQEERIGEVAAGAVLKHSRDFNLTREAVLGSALSPETPAYDLQQACATGLETVLGLANKIKLGQIDSAIAGGVDSASDAPIAVSEGLREVLLDLNRAKSLPDRLKVLSRLRPKDLAPDAPNTGEPRTGLSMGEHQALTTAQWKISREAQDEIAFNSHHNLAAAYDRGFFDDLVTPYRGLSRDSNLRPDTSMEKLATLKPVFGKSLGAEATMTAGNSTPLTDGASTVLLGTEDWADARGLPKLAVVVDGEAAAVDFVHGKDGLLMAPAFAVPRLLARNGLSFEDIDFFEIHEAFAGTVLSTLAAWEDEEFGRTRLARSTAPSSTSMARPSPPDILLPPLEDASWLRWRRCSTTTARLTAALRADSFPSALPEGRASSRSSRPTPLRKVGNRHDGQIHAVCQPRDRQGPGQKARTAPTCRAPEVQRGRAAGSGSGPGTRERQRQNRRLRRLGCRPGGLGPRRSAFRLAQGKAGCDRPGA